MCTWFWKMIEVDIVDGVPLVWKAEDVCELREKHNIVGSLVGSLPRYPKQDVHLGLPLQLMPEEATLLQDKGIAVLMDHSKPRPYPTEDEVKKFEETRKRIFNEQVEHAKTEKRKQLERLKSEIEEGRRAKRKKLVEQQVISAEDVPDTSFDIEAEWANYTLPAKAALVQIPTVRTEEKQDPHAHWTFPSNTDERLRYRVFQHFWEQGYFLTTGTKFGGDYLVYPGDPGRYHSFYIAICIQKDRPFTPVDIATYARLGTNVKKTVVLCSTDDHDKLTCTSIQWTGIT